MGLGITQDAADDRSVSRPSPAACETRRTTDRLRTEVLGTTPPSASEELPRYSATTALGREEPEFPALLSELCEHFDAGKQWYSMLYGAAMRQGDLDWLHFVNTVFTISMFGHETALYDEAFKTFFGLGAPSRTPGFPTI